jgi:hypothetical protein
MELNFHQSKLARNFDRPYSDITREEKLLYLRFILERDHRGQMFVSSAWRTYEPPVNQPLPTMSEFDIPDICNKSVPVYILKGHLRFAGTLYNYLYRRWFKPFQSEIEYGRFIAKFIAPTNAIQPIMASMDSILALHKAICTNIHEQHEAWSAAIASGVDDYRISKNHQNYILQPLFQALILIVDPQDWNGEDSSLIGRLPVTIARTEMENGLSSPITFESIADKIDEYIGETVIETTLETAITFVMELEARETRAFGLKPDPVASWDPDVCLSRWRDIMPYDELIGPSSQFVDVEKVPQSLHQLKRDLEGFFEHFPKFEQREGQRYIQRRSQQQP